MTDKELIFMPGCFDNFDGDQDELDEFVASIKELFASKSIEELDVMSVEFNPEFESDFDIEFEADTRVLN